MPDPAGNVSGTPDGDAVVGGLPTTRGIQQECTMTTQQLSFLIPPYGTATLTLPALLTPEAFVRLESAIDRVLGVPQQQLGDTATAPDPGSIEFDSWLIQRQ
jgi:hypothetical protein